MTTYLGSLTAPLFEPLPMRLPLIPHIGLGLESLPSQRGFIYVESGGPPTQAKFMMDQTVPNPLTSNGGVTMTFVAGL
jgi:hypothetical protein